MATFDQLPAEQRAIIELVVARGRSYDALADVLQVSAQRVRELARDALVELSPVTGERVEPQWRGQVADYLLGQQSNAESTATRAHLKRSEAARTWALSLLDALDALYANGDRPSIPEAEAAASAAADGDEAVDGDEAAVADAETRPRERVREREKLGRERTAVTREPRERERTKERGREREPERGRDRERERERDEADGTAARKDLSPAAQAALRRRRILGAAGALALIAAIVVGVLALTGAFSSDDEGSSGSSSASSGTTPTTPATSTGTANQQQPQVLGQIPLSAVGGAKAQGVAYILQQGSQQVLAVTAKLPPLPSTQRKAAYNVWLFNSQKDVASIGAQFTTPQGDYQGVGPLPKNYKRFKFIDVSKQPFNNRTGHSGQSLLRGALANIKPVPQNQQPGAQQPGAQQPGGGGTAP